MANQTCLFISYLTILFAVYFLILTPLLYIHLDPKFPTGEKTAYRVGYWCTALAVYLIILIVSLLIVKFRRSRNIQPPTDTVETYRSNSRDHLLAAATITEPTESSCNGSIVALRKTEPIYVNGTDRRPQLKSIEIGCQTESILLPKTPLTPREKYFFDIMRDGTEPQRYSSTPPRGPYISTKLFTEDDLYVNHKDLHRFLAQKESTTTEEQQELQKLKKLNERFLNEERTACGDEETKRTSKDFYYVPPAIPVVEPMHSADKGARETLKSEVFIEVFGDCTNNVENEKIDSINHDNDDVFY